MTTENNAAESLSEATTGADGETPAGANPGEVSTLEKTIAEGGESASLVTNAPDAELPKDYLREDGTIDSGKVAAALARVAADIPGEGEDYSYAFPESVELKGEDGQPLVLDTADPVVAKFGEIAKKHNAGQGLVTELMGLYAEMIDMSQKASTARGTDAQAAELKLLDADPDKAEARVTAAAAGAQKILGPELGKILIDNITTAGMVRVVEAFLDTIGSEGAGDPNEPGGKSEKRDPADILYG